MQIECVDKGFLAYADFLSLQHHLHAQAITEKRDFLLFCSHAPVYTLGRQTRFCDFNVPLQELPAPLFRVQRGGRIAYHDSGQLMVYPIVDISRWFNRSIGQFTAYCIRVLKDTLQEFIPRIEAREDGLWVGDKKIVFMGLGFRKWVSMHGFAVNITTDLTAYQYIKPCGRPIEVDNLTSFIRQKNCKDIILDRIKTKFK